MTGNNQQNGDEIRQEICPVNAFIFEFPIEPVKSSGNHQYRNSMKCQHQAGQNQYKPNLAIAHVRINLREQGAETRQATKAWKFDEMINEVHTKCLFDDAFLVVLLI